jgi:hypothetical protein
MRGARCAAAPLHCRARQPRNRHCQTGDAVAAPAARGGGGSPCAHPRIRRPFGGIFAPSRNFCTAGRRLNSCCLQPARAPRRPAARARWSRRRRGPRPARRRSAEQPASCVAASDACRVMQATSLRASSSRRPARPARPAPTPRAPSSSSADAARARSPSALASTCAASARASSGGCGAAPVPHPAGAVVSRARLLGDARARRRAQRAAGAYRWRRKRGECTSCISARASAAAAAAGVAAAAAALAEQGPK